MSDKIIYEKSDGIGLLTINNPDKFNALDSEMLKVMKNAIDDIQDDDSARVMIITGTGSKAFVSGADLGDVKINLKAGRKFAREGISFFEKLETCSKPVICAVNGLAFGGGVEITLCSDIVVASDNALFSFPESGLGLVPIIGMVRLQERVGRSKSKELMMTGEKVSAEEALRIGLVNKVVSYERLMEEVLGMAKKIISKAPFAIELIKSAVDRNLRANGFAYAYDSVGSIYVTQDVQEGLQAFFEKRKPTFKGL